MAKFWRVCLWVASYLGFSLLSLVLAIALLEGFHQGNRIKEKSFGSEEQRFYFLLVDRAISLSMKGYIADFSEGISEEGRQALSELINSVHYRRDCVLDRSIAIQEGISCSVNGRSMEFIQHGPAD